MTIEQDVQRFKMELLRKMPFYGDIVMRLVFEESSRIPTACTNGRNIYYNPAFLEKLSQGERYFVLMHEVFHVILQHCRRSVERDPDIWNTACDLIVNQMLVNLRWNMQAAEIPFSRPEAGIFATVPRGLVTEELYEKIAADNKKRQKGSKKILMRRHYQWKTAPASDMQEIDVPGDLDSYAVGADGMPVDTDRIQSGIAMNEQLIKKIVRDAMQKNRSDSGRYYIPDQLLLITESKRLNWKTLLKDFLNQEISDETSYMTPERKYLHMDMILPGCSMTDEFLEEIWAFVDSSGSISQNEMNQFLTQLYRISKEFHCIINICYWDTQVTDVYRNIRNEKDLLKCVPKHSGGTNINCVYQWIHDNRIKPDVMLILTDGLFGSITTPAFKPVYRQKTILVLSSGRPVTDEMRKIGKIATL